MKKATDFTLYVVCFIDPVVLGPVAMVAYIAAIPLMLRTSK